MRAWEIWTGPVFGPHPVLLVSAQARIDRKQALVVLRGVTMRPGQPFKVDALQATLDQEDGLETQTRFDCDLLCLTGKHHHESKNTTEHPPRRTPC